MPSIKELRFFTMRPDRVIRKRVRGLEKRLADENITLDPAGRKFCEIFLDIIRSKKYGEFEAYRELWTVADDRVAGELTPDYA